MIDKPARIALLIDSTLSGLPPFLEAAPRLLAALGAVNLAARS